METKTMNVAEDADKKAVQEFIVNAINNGDFTAIDNRASEPLVMREYCKIALATMFSVELDAEVNRQLFGRVREFYSKVDWTGATDTTEKTECESAMMMMCLVSLNPDSVKGLKSDEALVKSAYETCKKMSADPNTLHPKDFEFFVGYATYMGLGTEKDKKGGLAIMKKTAPDTTFGGQNILQTITSKKPTYIRIPLFIIKFIVGFIGAWLLVVPFGIIMCVFGLIGMAIPSANHTAKNVERSLKRIYSAIWQWIKK